MPMSWHSPMYLTTWGVAPRSASEVSRAARKWTRVMGLEVGRLVGEQGVGGAVGLVEAVLGELLDLLEELVRLGRG